MSTTVHPFARGFIQRLVELAEGGGPVVGVFAVGVGVVDEAGKAGAISGHGPFQHLLVAVGIAEGEDRAATDELVDGDGLAGLVIDDVDLASRIRIGQPCSILNDVTIVEPTTCSGGMP